MKQIRYLIEAFFVYIFLTAFKILPVDFISKIMGITIAALGGFLKADKVCKKNLKMVFNDKSDAEINKIANSVWDNLGRNFAEYPFVTSMSEKQFKERVTVIGAENLTRFTDKKQPVILISAHFANWEITYAFLKQYKIETNMIFRTANNPYVNKMVVSLRNAKNFKMYKKGQKGALEAIRGLKKGEILASFVDQKLNEGIDVPFFGKDAKTPPLTANLALKHDYPIIPIHVVRKNGVNFDLIIEEPLSYNRVGDNEKDVYKLLSKINKHIEGWIEQNPEQWFWVHNRWPKERR